MAIATLVLCDGASPLLAQNRLTANICNRGTQTVRVAVVYPALLTYVAEGWFAIEPGTCENVARGGSATHYLAFSMRDGRGTPALMLGRPAAGDDVLRPTQRSFCVREERFRFTGTIAALGRCNDPRTDQLVPFNLMVQPHAGPVVATYTVRPGPESRVRPFPGPPHDRYLLGLAYERGLTPRPRDPAKAAQLYREAADQGYGYAEFALASLYERGEGVPQSYSNAFAWYRRAATSGVARAQRAVGYYYAQGRGTAANPAEAARWYRRAAAQGDATAQHNLAHMYEEGSGVPRDLAEARRLYRAAAEAGHDESRTDLERLR